MSNLRTVFRIVRIVGLLAILALFLRSEWRFVSGHLPHILSLRIQFYAIASLLLIPVFWALFVVTLGSHVGKWIVERRMKKAEAEE